MNYPSHELRGTGARSLMVVLILLLAAVISSCGKKEQPFDTNLLKNPSFEKVKDGIPQHWTLTNFKGVEGQPESRYGIDDTAAVDGQKSWYFKGDPGTRRWFALTQEIEIPETRFIRLRGWTKTLGVQRQGEQYHHSNFVLTYYDEDHVRFTAYRFWDKRTKFKRGTTPWGEVNELFRIPKGTRYVAVSCLLGCDGKVWFDDVSLTATQPLDWQIQRTKNFVFHWLSERPFPTGSIESQQRLFDHFSNRLGLESDIVIGYYLYPDTATFREIMRSDSYQYVAYDDLEIHTINPNENHEIIHMITDLYGRAPRAIAEGTVFWLYDEWKGKPINEQAVYYMAKGELPTVQQLTNLDDFNYLSTSKSIPAAASFIGFIVDRFGTEKLLELYKAIPEHGPYAAFARGFEEVYGTPCEEVERQWRLWLKSQIAEEPAEQETP